jgi:hypothetical protein
MKTKITRFMCAAGMLLAVSCSNVVVKQPAGDKIPKLKQEQWAGTWRGPDNFRGVSRIKDAKQGLIELKSLEKNEDGTEEEPLTLAVREMGDRVIVTALDGTKLAKPGPFYRAVISDEFAAFFPVKEDLIREAVKQGTITGRELSRTGDDITEGAKVVEIDQFGSAEAAKLLPAGISDYAACFEPDPAYVLVREKKEK